MQSSRLNQSEICQGQDSIRHSMSKVIQSFRDKLVDVVVKLRQRGKNDQPPKLLCDIKMVLIFFFENAKNFGQSDDAKRRK